MNRSFVRAAACALAAAAVTAVLLAVPAATPSQAASITISDPNCTGFNWDSASNTLSCTGGGGGGGGSISCSITLSTGSPTLSTAETLTANCSGSTGTVTYQWTAAAGNAGACPGITAQANPIKADVAAPGGSTALNCTYNLSANDSGTNTTSTPSKQISYSVGGGGGGGGGGGNISCNGFASTHVIDAGTWLANGLYYTANAGGFGQNDAVVVKFTTTNVTTSSKIGSFNGVEYQAPTTPRYGALSDTPCDFTNGLLVVGSGGSRTAFAPGSVGISSQYTLFNAKPTAATLLPNTTYYINIANMPGTCGVSCDMLITIKKPSGT